MKRALAYLCLWCTAFAAPMTIAAPSVALVVPSDDTPAGYDLIGVYLVESISRVRSGRMISIPIKDTRYRVYSNGQELRVYQAGVSDSYHSYAIYRSDGISAEDAHGNISVSPGLQAKHSSNDTIKQLSLTQGSLTITQFPPISDTVVITFAKRLAVGATNR